MLVFPTIGTHKPNNLNNLNKTKTDARYDFEIILKSTEYLDVFLSGHPNSTDPLLE
jgi:hypothetical protein